MLLLLALTLTSPDLTAGARVPAAFVWSRDGCSGANRTPRLRWSAPPPGTRSFALTVIDPDAPKPGGWVHWRVEGIPAAARGLGSALPRGAVVAKNDFGTTGWGGPCPPPGPLHHYVFTLRALDGQGRVLAGAVMTPVYQR